VRILDRFDPHQITASITIRMHRAVARWRSVWEVGAALVIHKQAVAAFGPRGDQRFDRWNDANADDHHFGGKQGAVRWTHAGHPPISSFDAVHHHSQPDIDAACAVLALEEPRELHARDTPPITTTRSTPLSSDSMRSASARVRTVWIPVR